MTVGSRTVPDMLVPDMVLRRERLKAAEEVLTSGALPSWVFGRLRWAPGQDEAWSEVWARRSLLPTEERVVFEWLAGQCWRSHELAPTLDAALCHCQTDEIRRVVARAGATFAELTIRLHFGSSAEVTG